jgi:hypothetical protein
MNIVIKIGLIMLSAGLLLMLVFLLLRLFLKKKQMNWFTVYGISAEAAVRIIAVKKIYHVASGRSSSGSSQNRDWYSWDITEEVSWTANGRPMVKEYTRGNGCSEDQIGDTRNLTLFCDPQEPEYTSLSDPKSYNNIIVRWVGYLMAVGFLGMPVVIIGVAPEFGFILVGAIGLFILVKWRAKVKADKRKAREKAAQVAE